MPRKDVIHLPIRAALEKDGWQITADPYKVIWEGKTYLPDLGAERVIAATRGTEKIAVEIPVIVVDIESQTIVQWIK
ncbi:MAG: hypothetical protein IT258_16730 [Saprospiraceae bacterium]|nr:hypothetical protein [Saprospiraceae bacterium]